MVELFEAGVDGGVPWVASRFVDGPDLSSLRLAQPATRADHLTAVTRVGLCIAEALAHAHEHGVVHGDLSPRNILLGNGSDPVLIDFGAAVTTFDGDALREIVQPRQLFRGTPGYASPEQILGTPADSRSDLYALGCILYELLSGLPPFAADNVEALCQQHLHLAPEPPSSKLSLIPPDLDELVLALLEKRPNARLRRAQELMETLARYCSLEQNQDQPSSSRPRALSLHRPHLVGRADALQYLTACIDDAASGRGGLVLVTGASGIGKTRVLNELSNRARGFRVMYGRCGAVSQSRSGETLSAGRALEPFAPFLEWLAYRRPAAVKSADYATWLQVLAPYEPTLEASLPTSSLLRLPPDLGRFRVLDALLNLLVTSAAEQPLLLIVDDLQWADDLSRAFLQQEYRFALKSSNVLIIAAHRSEDPEPASCTEEVRRVQLNPLTEDELGALAIDMLGAQLVPAGLVEVLQRHSEGNPFFAAEYIRAFIECGVLRYTADGDWTLSTQVDTIAVSVPSSLRALFALRLHGLSATAKEALEFSALLGRQFRYELLAAIMHDTSRGASVRDAVAELVSHRILDPCGEDQYRFVHDKLREAQAQAISDGRRQSAHRTIAELLDAPNYARRLDVPIGQIGLHWAEAGDPARAISHLRLAAEQAASQYMNADAAELYAIAISQIQLADVHGSVTQGHWADLAISLGEARGDLLGWAARHQEAHQQYDASLNLVDSSNVLLRARFERKKARAYWTLHDYGSAKASLSRADAALGPVHALSRTDEIHEWIEIQLGLFWLHYYARKAGSSTEALMRKMGAVVERHGTPMQKSMFYVCASSDSMARERYSYSEVAVNFARRANVEVSIVPHEVAQAADGRFVLAFALLHGTTSQCREAINLFEENVKALTPIGEATLLARSLVYQAIAWRRLGDTEATLAAAERARRSAERVRLPSYIGASVACEAWVRWKGGDLATARRLAEDARIWWAKVPHSFPFYWLGSLILLDFHYLNDDFTSALDVISELTDSRQQRLHADVDESLIACKDALLGNVEPRRCSLALRRVLEMARQYRYI